MSSSASSVKSSPIQADIEAILQRQRDDCQKRPIPPSTTMTCQEEEEDYPPYGVIQPRRMVLPNKEQPNILNQAMAEEAAMKYEQKQGQIQQAIAELAMKKQKQKKTSAVDNDNDDPTEDPTDEGDDDDETMDEAANVVEQKPVDANEMARTVWQQVRKGLRPLRSGWEE
jgi:hypothetical protein